MNYRRKGGGHKSAQGKLKPLQKSREPISARVVVVTNQLKPSDFVADPFLPCLLCPPLSLGVWPAIIGDSRAFRRNPRGRFIKPPTTAPFQPSSFNHAKGIVSMPECLTHMASRGVGVSPAPLSLPPFCSQGGFERFEFSTQEFGFSNTAAGCPEGRGAVRVHTGGAMY